MSTTQALLAAIERHLETTGMAATTFGRKAVNDGKLVGRLRNGGSVTLPKARVIEAYLATHPAAANGDKPEAA